jgi:hypothetical protein
MLASFTPTHIPRTQLQTHRKGSTKSTSLSRGPPSFAFLLNQNATPVNYMNCFDRRFWTPSSNIPGPRATKHIHFNHRVEQCIAVSVGEDKEDNAVSDDGSEEDALSMMRSKHSHSSTIARLPATTLRPGHEPVHQKPYIAAHLLLI